MKMIIFGNENDILLSSDWISVLEIQNKRLFGSYVGALYSQINGNNENKSIHLYDEGKELDIKKNILYISDLLSFNFNDRSILGGLQKKLERIQLNETEQWSKIENKYLEFYSYAMDLIYEIDLDIESSSEISIAKILKAFEIKIIDINEHTYLEKLLILIDVVSELELSLVIVFINLKTYLDPADLLEFYKYSAYRKIQVLLIESTSCIEKIKYERKIIIDTDFDEILIT